MIHTAPQPPTAAPKLRIAILEDDSRARDALRILMAAQPGIECVGTFGNATSILAGLAGTGPVVEPGMVGAVMDSLRLRPTAALSGGQMQAFRQALGARYLVRAGRCEVTEGRQRSRTVALEFPSYQAALDCYRSADYQAARALRLGKGEIDLVILEGYDGN